MLYIVTPVFNRKTFTENYLKALSEQTVKDFKTIIVDDGSTDGTAEMITEQFPEVILLREKGDLWWAEATNVGVRYAMEHGATYIMTLNDDTVPDPDYIEKMIYWSNKQPEVLLGALALDYNTNKMIFGGENRSWKTGKSTYVLDTLSENERFGLHEVNLFPGRGLLIPKKVFDTIGLYDSKNFPQTIADNDFTHRAVNHGFKIYCNFDAKIKIYPDESGNVKLQRERSWKNYYQHLFGMRGGGNLKWFTICVLKNCPKKYLFPFLFYGLSSRIAGYLIKWIKSSFREIFTKEKIIEKIKQTKLFTWTKNKFYLTQLGDYTNEFLNQANCDVYLADLLSNDFPCMIARFGSTELKVLECADKKKKFTEKIKYIILNNSGVFPNNDYVLDNFSKLYFENIRNIDLLGVWFNPYENKIAHKYCPKAKITTLRNLEPYFSNRPWSFYLKNKKVLVVHPFSQSIENQFKKRELLFQDKNILPIFELISYPAVQSLGGTDEYESWFDALDKMKNDIQKIDFDIAIIGAGAYGLPLASYVKEIGKKAIHLGGATQMLFGVYGQRWEIHPDFKDLINEHWIKPSEDEKPMNANKVENACYW